MKTWSETRLVEGISTMQMCELAGVSYRQLDYWMRVGALVPSLQESSGSGTRRVFAPSDVLLVRVMAHVVRFTDDTMLAGEVVGVVAEERALHGDVFGWVLVSKGQSMICRRLIDLTECLRELGGCAVVVDLAELEMTE